MWPKTYNRSLTKATLLNSKNMHFINCSNCTSSYIGVIDVIEFPIEKLHLDL